MASNIEQLIDAFGEACARFAGFEAAGWNPKEERQLQQQKKEARERLLKAVRK